MGFIFNNNFLLCIIRKINKNIYINENINENITSKKTKSTPIDLLRVIDIPKGNYDIPTLKSSNIYIPYASYPYKGKTYINMFKGIMLVIVLETTKIPLISLYPKGSIKR
ncbi:hypothetical protein PFNF54_04840 [Plasmodium falciparum NF54]|uniref:Plasmodium falciparum erythrocyte membrane protein 1 acidic terminal segment domain-containing protein n=1 Tax=Plasmodium falciparum (isolate NF54) TaxID=5843 RepID=W7JYE8_PLAFO|nr:hypothetical protein PFNF54_04840 [Plasmodium falciparum NF54]